MKAKENVSLEEILNTEDVFYCIEDENDLRFSLCGLKFETAELPVPYDEVPEEQTCKECLAVERYLIKNGKL